MRSLSRARALGPRSSPRLARLASPYARLARRLDERFTRDHGFHWVPLPRFSAWRRCSATPSAWLPRWSTNEATGKPRPRPRPRPRPSPGPRGDSTGVQPGSRGEGGSKPAGGCAATEGSRGRGSSRTGGCRRGDTDCSRRGDTDSGRRGEARAASWARWMRARPASPPGTGEDARGATAPCAHPRVDTGRPRAPAGRLASPWARCDTPKDGRGSVGPRSRPRAPSPPGEPARCWSACRGAGGKSHAPPISSSS